MRGVLPGERDDPACSLDTETREMLIGEFLWRVPVLGIVDHALDEDAGADHDGLARNLAGNPLNVFACAPINLFHDGLCGRAGGIPVAYLGARWRPIEGRGFIVPLTVQDAKEIMCLAHIYATAGKARVAFSADVHDYGVDGTFKVIIQRGTVHTPSGIPLDYQAKATEDWSLDGDDIVYDLDARAYNNIAARTASDTTMILILLCLPKDAEKWHETTTETTTLRHCCYWYVVTGDLTDNTASKRIKIPRANLFTPTMLADLLELERLRREGQAR